MRKLTGTVTCSAASKIEKGAVAEIQVVDVSRMDAAAKVLGKIHINDPLEFPFKFEVEYDDEPIKQMPGGQFAVGVRINRKDQLEFINDTRFSIVDYETRAILDNIDVFVIKI